MGRHKTSRAKSRGYRHPKAPSPSNYQRGRKKTNQQKFEKWLAKIKAEQNRNAAGLHGGAIAELNDKPTPDTEESKR